MASAGNDVGRQRKREHSGRHQNLRERGRKRAPSAKGPVGKRGEMCERESGTTN